VSQADIDVILDQFAATNGRDFDRVMDFYAEDVRLDAVGGLNAGIFEGKQSVGEWFGDWLRTFEHDYRFEITEVRDLGSGLVYLVAAHGGKGRASGVEVHTESKYLYRVTDGKITRVGVFFAGHDPLDPETLRQWSDPETG
jgi:ketosteroid isomerase-like protein